MPGPSTSTLPPEGGPSAGRLVGGRYRLQQVVGRGGMATVHLAEDEVLHRPVAVKLLHDHLAHDPTFLDRFRREARIAARLEHPNVVAVHDWAEGTEDGAYLVLQYVDGPSLREVLRVRGQLSPREALAVLGPAATGLQAAHAAGLVHLDIKPENLLLGRDGTVRVTDFGLARMAASTSSTFGADVLVGSPHYLSPEAVRGEPLDARADVYALGIVLFECLTGRPPHEADSPFATAVAHTSQPVPPPSTLVPGLAPGLDDVVAASTHRDLAHRTADAAAFGRGLAATVVGGPAQLTPLLADPDGDDVQAAGQGAPSTDGPPPAPTDRAVPERRAATRPAPDRRTASLSPADGVATSRVQPAGRRGRRARGADQLGAPAHPWRRRFAVLLVLLGSLLASGTGGYLLWDQVLAPVTAVPDVRGAPAGDARARLVDAGFTVELAGDRPHDREVPEGHVLDQAPDGEARAGSTVELVISAGPAQVAVPDVIGTTADQAADLLRAAGLEIARTELHDEEVAEGLVLTTSPPAEDVVDEGSTVTLTVSLGPAPIDVPELTGSGEDEARSVLAELGLTLRIEDRRHDAQPAGAILEQDPAAGAQLTRGAEVTVVVSDGPAPVPVPNVRDLRLEEAITELADAGFDVEVERRGGLGAFLRPGRVIDQDPPPGSLLVPGSSVLVYAYND